MLERFTQAQADTFDAALAELRAGRKTGHWIWFVFPQLQGLGQSETSRRFAIRDLEEARAYLADATLGRRLREAAAALLGLPGERTAHDVLGETDAMKLRSSMTLFARAAPCEPVFRQVLERFYAGIPDPRTDALLGRSGEGWFVGNAAEADWLDGRFGAYTRFERSRFPQIGVNIGVLAPGQPACMYHGEDEQEDFLVLQGEGLLLIEEQELPVRQWDFVHCPAWARHVFVGAGSGPCTILAIGGRSGGDVVYPVSAVALRHAAGVEVETTEPEVAYAGTPDDESVAFDPRWLP